MNEELGKIAESNLVTYFGVADLSKVAKAAVDQAGSGLDGYPYCITLGIALPNPIVDRLPYSSNHADALNYKHHAYDVINNRLDNAASIVGSFIQSKGYKAFPVPASKRANPDKLLGAFSHKLGARLAGFGWIGKSCLLITPDSGPRVRWTSILADAPLKPTGKVAEEQCGDCTACVDICPVHAFSGKAFKEGEPREVRFDANKCQAYFDSMKEAGKLDVCGLCLYICPQGRKQV